MRKRSILLISILIILAAGGVIGYKMWNKPFTDPLEGDAINVTAEQLFKDFSTNEAEAQKNMYQKNSEIKKCRLQDRSPKQAKIQMARYSIL